MSNFSSCGIDCSTCQIGKERACSGCHTLNGEVFWGKCDLYRCANEKNLPHCGKCNRFPCDTLKEWAKTENPERIDNLRKL